MVQEYFWQENGKVLVMILCKNIVQYHLETMTANNIITFRCFWLGFFMLWTNVSFGILGSGKGFSQGKICPTKFICCSNFSSKSIWSRNVMNTTWPAHTMTVLSKYVYTHMKCSGMSKIMPFCLFLGEKMWHDPAHSCSPLHPANGEDDEDAEYEWNAKDEWSAGRHRAEASW